MSTMGRTSQVSGIGSLGPGGSPMRSGTPRLAGPIALLDAGPASYAEAATLLMAESHAEAALGRLDGARSLVRAAIAVIDTLLQGDDDADDDLVYLWCQAQESLARFEGMSRGVATFLPVETASSEGWSAAA
jgi:hypothetical protein